MIPPPSLCGGEGSSSPGSAPPNGTVNSKSVVVVKYVDSGLVIGYQVDELTYTSAGHFIAQSHIYPALMVVLSMLAHFPIESGCNRL